MNTPRSGLQRIAAALAGLALLASPASATDASEIRTPPTWERQVYDAVVLRPLAFGNLLAGAACFVVAYPITQVTGGSGHVLRYCWEEPLDRTFRRPLGEL